MFISFSVKRFGPHFSFYLLFPEFSVLPLLARSPAPTPPHTPPGVWSGNVLMVTASHSRKDGRGLQRVIPGCCPPCRGWRLSLWPGPPFLRCLVTVCLTKRPLSPQVSAAHMVGERNGNRPAELFQGLRRRWQKAKLWRAQRVSLLPQRKTREEKPMLN